MNHKNTFLFLGILIFCSGCGGAANKTSPTAMPAFFTATLPPTPIQQQATQDLSATATMPAPSAESNIPPVEGMTTTQVNVRAGSSTASKILGMIGPFVKVQVTGRDANKSWYQIIYAESELGKGWVRAEYVQINAPAEIPLVETTAGSGAAISGLVIQKINVRNGPGITYQLLGELNSNDVVFITGKDSDGAWLQIEFANAPDGMGWVTAEFLQTGNIESVPVLGNAVADATSTPTEISPTVAPSIQDGDSMQAPLATTFFSAAGSRALQVNNAVSAANGDAEDWVQFTTANNAAIIEVICPANTLQVELWNEGKPVENFSLSCGDTSLIAITPNSNYFLRILESNINAPDPTNYILSVKNIR